jgi:hypothetical protein
MPDKSVSDETESEGEGGHSRKVENRVSKLEKEVGALGRDFDFVQEQLVW